MEVKKKVLSLGVKTKKVEALRSNILNKLEVV